MSKPPWLDKGCLSGVVSSFKKSALQGTETARGGGLWGQARLSPGPSERSHKEVTALPGALLPEGSRSTGPWTGWHPKACWRQSPDVPPADCFSIQFYGDITWTGLLMGGN